MKNWGASGDARQVSADDLAPQRSGIFASLTTKDGRVVRGEPQADHVVRIGEAGIPMTLEQAASLGYAHRDAAGRWLEGRDPRLAPAEESGPVQGDGFDPRLSDQAEEELGEIIQAADHYIGKGSAVAMLSRWLSTGEVPAEVTYIARQSGTPVGDIKTALESATAELVEQANRVLAEEGVSDTEAARRWALETLGPIRLHQATLAQVFQGDVKPLREMAKAYLLSNPLDGVKASETERLPSGRRYTYLTTADGRRVPVAAAAAKRVALKIGRS